MSSQKRLADGRVGPVRQRGAVLIFSLIVLLIMTVLVVSGAGNSVLEQRMATNYVQTMTAFQAAEQGLRIAEGWLYSKLANDEVFQNISSSSWYFTDTTTSDGLYTAIDSHSDSAKVCLGSVDCEFDPRDEDQWCSDMGNSSCKLPKGFVTLSDSIDSPTSLNNVELASVGQDIDGDGTIDSVAKQPQFIIEYVGPARVEALNITLGTTSITSSRHAFRITVIAWGPDESVRQVLESHVILPL
jgi:type IV pilus assembly protein PilX